MNTYTFKLKERSRELRKQGFSFGALTRLLGVPRSTLHSWVSDIKRTKKLLKKDRYLFLKKIQPLGAKANKIQRERRITEIKCKISEEIKKYDINNIDYLKTIISFLYWTEGSKSRGTVIFTNTDPNMSLLFITLLRKCYAIDEGKLRIRLHLHDYHDVNKTKSYWSNLLGVSESQFGKIFIKERNIQKKYRKNFLGICFIKYYSESLREELLQRSYQIANLINYRFIPVAQRIEHRFAEPKIPVRFWSGIH